MCLRVKVIVTNTCSCHRRAELTEQKKKKTSLLSFSQTTIKHFENHATKVCARGSTSKRNVKNVCIKHVWANLGGEHSFREFWAKSAFGILMSNGGT